MSEIINNGHIERQVNIDEVTELHIHTNDSLYVENFTEVESIIECLFPENLQRLLKSFGDIVDIDEALSKRDEATAPSAIMFRKDKGSKYYNVKGMYWGEL